MFFKDVNAIKDYLPASNNFDFADIKPKLSSVTEDDIIPLISQELYDVLEPKFQSQSMSADEKELVKKIQRPLANMAYFNYIPFGNVTFGRGNISVAKGQDMEIASQWRIEDVRQACEDEFYKGSEKLLLFLESKRAVFTEWAGSDSFTRLEECFINTAQDFSEHFEIGGSRRIFLMMKGIMKQVEKDFIRSVTGYDLFAQIKTQVAADTVSDNNKILLEFIKPAVANFTGSLATLRLPVKWTGRGIQVLSTSFTQTMKVETAALEAQLKPLRDAAMAEGEKQKKLLTDYLFKNHATYPLYEADDTVYTPTRTTTVNDGDSSTGWF